MTPTQVRHLLGLSVDAPHVSPDRKHQQSLIQPLHGVISKLTGSVREPVSRQLTSVHKHNATASSESFMEHRG